MLNNQIKMKIYSAKGAIIGDIGRPLLTELMVSTKVKLSKITIAALFTALQAISICTLISSKKLTKVPVV